MIVSFEVLYMQRFGEHGSKKQLISTRKMRTVSMVKMEFGPIFLPPLIPSSNLFTLLPK